MALPLPAQAQWIAAGRWGTAESFRYVPPGTWMVLTEGATASASAEGEHHQGRIELQCGPGVPAGRLSLSAYRGGALTGAGSQPVRLVIDGEPFDRVLHYRPEQRDWRDEGGLEPGFLDALGSGARLEVLNAAGQRVTALRLNGSGAARATLRRVCGL